MQWWSVLIIAVVAAAIAGIAGFVFGGEHRKRVAESAIGSATKEAKRIVNEAISQAESKKKKPFSNQRTKSTSAGPSLNVS